ncbi:MAG: hypothetical protein GX984_06420 [Erysipelothrix sp.]|nr:hypothetical protein [Erysipelothrix sp.]
MKKILYVDCCIRKESRTQTLAQNLLKTVNKDIEVVHLKLTNLDLKPLINERFKQREELLAEENLTHQQFKYAHQFAKADHIIIAAPFWDLSFPSLLKIYIENCAVDGITFKSTDKGLQGLCTANNLIYLTTRGGFYQGKPEDQATPYLKHICTFFGIKNFYSIAADGMDIVGHDAKTTLEIAQKDAEKLGKKLFK